MSRPQGVNNDELGTRFQELRPRLIGAAYALTGSVQEAEDVVQDAWLRLSRSQTDTITDIEGWLVTTVSRLALDVLRSARARRETYVGPWLPEPVVQDADPGDHVARNDTLNLAVLVVLETLSPAERAVFVLHEVFGVPFDEVATAVGRTPAACRQMARRARRHVAARTPRFEVDSTTHRRAVDAFVTAATAGDLTSLTRLLDPDVVLRTDGGGQVRAALNPIHGSERVLRFLGGVTQRFNQGTSYGPATVNGLPGLLRYHNGQADAVVSFVVAHRRVIEIHVILNPEKLRTVT
ncbi:RNA polymerase sigma factor SigJ [Lipingzhangella sp. LS1_29]|uniref:RNA polymerase sigma factor SigJ n=1 Tax=Lipingzhangella rawalii TaxID=2055835 RepID=A0ABU2H389_9ACTN|nr:RNA polymerase sigma factor SigJ [Lipingzhangella rawalii]MDS1269772.1 RNA polymerase sigma factor SigJ [Lipingzhangella rawalii]